MYFLTPKMYKTLPNQLNIPVRYPSFNYLGVHVTKIIIMCLKIICLENNKKEGSRKKYLNRVEQRAAVKLRFFVSKSKFEISGGENFIKMAGKKIVLMLKG